MAVTFDVKFDTEQMERLMAHAKRLVAELRDEFEDRIRELEAERDEWEQRYEDLLASIGGTAP